MKSMTRPNKIWYSVARFFNRNKCVGGVWYMLFTAIVLFIACLATGLLLHLLIDAFSNDTIATMKL